MAVAGIVAVPAIAPELQKATGTSVGTSSTASRGGTPADKVFANGGKGEIVGPQSDVVILTASSHNSKTTDVIFTVSLECTILTNITTNNDNMQSMAHSSVRIWVEVDGKIVPINSAASPPNNAPAPGDDSDKVTFCDREYQRTVTDQEDPEDGVDQTQDYIRTKSSHSFQWIQQNIGSGDHTIEVHATLITEVPRGQGVAEAIIGNRIMVGEPTKMANDAII